MGSQDLPSPTFLLSNFFAFGVINSLPHFCPFSNLLTNLFISFVSRPRSSCIRGLALKSTTQLQPNRDHKLPCMYIDHFNEYKYKEMENIPIKRFCHVVGNMICFHPAIKSMSGPGLRPMILKPLPCIFFEIFHAFHCMVKVVFVIGPCSFPEQFLKQQTWKLFPKVTIQMPTTQSVL